MNHIRDTYLSIKDFAEKLSLHPNTIRNAIKKGKLQAVRIGIGRNACYRIPSSEIQRITLFDLENYFNKG